MCAEAAVTTLTLAKVTNSKAAIFMNACVAMLTLAETQKNQQREQQQLCDI